MALVLGGAGATTTGASPASRDRGSKIKIRRAKVFAEMRRLFLAEITNFPTKSGDLQKKRSSPKSEGFFWPKSQILTFFPAKNTNYFLPKNTVGGQEKNGGGGGKNENRGGIVPPAPPLATRLHD